MDLTPFAAEVGVDGPVTITGLGSRGGPVPGVRVVRAPAGVEWVQADEMTVCCGAGTPVAELAAALRDVGQYVALPEGGTVGGALAVGLSGIRRLGDGPVRDALLQARYVSAAGEVVTAGGPTVKNVSGFDLCRVLVGSRGTLGFLGEVILRTRPLAAASQWWSAPTADPLAVVARLDRPVSVLWDGATLWALIEGHPDDVDEQGRGAGLLPADGPPPCAYRHRMSVAPATIPQLPGQFLAEVGVGVVHVDREPSVTIRLDLHRRVKEAFDPAGRLNPGVVV
jgi:glycolate oxidase FAD binding subunit